MVDWNERRQAKLPDGQKSLLPVDFRVPVLSQVIVEFSRKADDPNVKSKELAQIIETDSGLTFELLKYVNSSAVGLRHKATTVFQALTLLGVRQAHLHLLTFVVQQSTSASKSKLIDSMEFWDTNLDRALFARAIAKHLGADADIAYTGGMLQDFLLPELTCRFEDLYTDYLDQKESAHGDLASFELETAGWNHAREGARLLISWGFPDELVYCVFCHHESYETLTDEELSSTAGAVTMSAMLPGPLRQVPAGPEYLFELERRLPEFQLLDVAAQVDQQFEELSSRTTNRRSLHNRIQEILQPAG